MKIRNVLMAALVALAPGAAFADFVEGEAVVNYRVSQVTPYTFDATDAGVSDYADLSACGGGVTATFSQSVDDTSTDALVEVRACATSSATWQECTLLRVGPDQLPDGVAVSIGNFPTSRPYALLRFPVGPSGGDTARVVLECTEETTTTAGGSGTPDDDSVTTAKIVNGTILPADIDTSPTGISWGAFKMMDFLGAVLNAGVVDTTVLGDGAVSVAKMYSSATDKLFGRDTAAAGQGQEIAVSGGIEFTGSNAIRVNASAIATGTLPVAQGGTGATTSTGTGAVVLATSPTLTTPNIGTATGSVSGNAGTATALAANGANCSANTYPLGVDASGAAEGCATIASAGITDGTIVNADVNASAAIAGTKLANTPAGGVSATTVQAAIDELDTEKANTADILTASQVMRTDADSAADDGTLSDWSAVNASDNNEGVKLPQATAPAQTGEGLISWDSDDDALVVGTGSAAKEFTGLLPIVNRQTFSASSVTTGNAVSWAAMATVDVAASAETARWRFGKNVEAVQLCLQLSAALTTTEGCRMYVSKNGTEITGSDLDAGTAALDATGETLCTAKFSSSITTSDYLQVIFGAPDAGNCADGTGCTCTAAAFGAAVTVWGREDL